MRLSLVNHLDKRWTSLIEIMAMIAVVGLAVTAMFSTVIGGIYFARDSENRIKAINLAREGIEWVTNLRNTNWLRFSSDQKNCWKIKDYDGWNCIGQWAVIVATFSLQNNTTHILTNGNGAWYLSTANATTGSGLWVDTNWFYVATGAALAGESLCTISKATDCRSPFTREIRISNAIANTGSMTVTSTIDWYEKRAQNVTLTTTLTNWKSKF